MVFDCNSPIIKMTTFNIILFYLEICLKYQLIYFRLLLVYNVIEKKNFDFINEMPFCTIKSTILNVYKVEQ